MQVGPDLGPLSNRGAAFFLSNILDPNREVDLRYQAYTVVTASGTEVSGILLDETDASIMLLAADGKRTVVPRDELELLQATGRSLMPEGFEQQIERSTTGGLAGVPYRADGIGQPSCEAGRSFLPRITRGVAAAK